MEIGLGFVCFLGLVIIGFSSFGKTKEICFSVDVNRYSDYSQAEMILAMAHLNYKDRNNSLQKPKQYYVSRLQKAYSKKFKGNIPTDLSTAHSLKQEVISMKNEISKNRNLKSKVRQQKMQNIDQLVISCNKLALSLS